MGKQRLPHVIELLKLLLGRVSGGPSGALDRLRAGRGSRHAVIRARSTLAVLVVLRTPALAVRLGRLRHLGVLLRHIRVLAVRLIAVVVLSVRWALVVLVCPVWVIIPLLVIGI